LLLGAIAALLLALYTAPNSFVEITVFSIIAGISGDVVLSKFKLLNQNSEEK